VREAVVIAREDSVGEKRLVAYYACDEAEVGAEELRKHLSGHLPEYMVPAAYVRLETFPLTPNGKVDRKALPAPDWDAYGVREYEAPKGRLEAALAAVWSDVLYVERIGRNDNFFELGGHSLLAMQAVSQCKSEGIDLSVIDLISNPTLKDLAGFVELNRKVDGAIPFRGDGNEPPLFMVHEGTGNLVYAEVLTPFIDDDIPVYGLPCQSFDEMPLRTMQGQAARMVQLILSIQPSGPYRIAGWSFGGLLAYEIAVQLIGKDQVVEFLGILDAGYEARNSVLPQEAQSDSEILIDVVDKSGKCDADGLRDLKKMAEESNFTNLVAKAKQMSVLPEYIAGLDAKQIIKDMEMMRIFGGSADRYFPVQIPICMHLFRAEHEKVSDPVYLGWSTVQPKERIRIVSVAGTHMTMMGADNITLFGKILSNEIKNSKNSPSRFSEVEYSPIINLNMGEKRVAPLICIPGAGDNVVTFAELVGNLNGLMAVYGIQPRGLDGEMVPHSSVPASAAFYLQALRQAQLEGSVHLLGHSFGGWVAYEMACQMEAAGTPVKSLTILDSEVPDCANSPIREYTHSDAILKLIEAIEQLVGRSSGVTISDLESKREVEHWGVLHRCLVNFGLISNRTKPEVIRGPLNTFGAALRTRYVPTVSYDGPVSLILVDDPKLDASTNLRKQQLAVEGWRSWAPNISYIHGSGTHMTMLKQPNVKTLASQIEVIY